MPSLGLDPGRVFAPPSGSNYLLEIVQPLAFELCRRGNPGILPTRPCDPSLVPLLLLLLLLRQLLL